MLVWEIGLNGTGNYITIYITKGENYVIVDVKFFRKINFHALFAVFFPQ